jgi:predicted nucleic acid-binding protein
LTSIVDTRLLFTLEFPPNPEIKQKTKLFLEKELKERLILPTIVLTEFVEIAGSRIGKEAAQNRLRLLKERGTQIAPLDEEHALIAGSLLLSNRNISTADAIIASYVKTGDAEYVITDDPHFKALGIKTKWL